MARHNYKLTFIVQSAKDLCSDVPRLNKRLLDIHLFQLQQCVGRTLEKGILISIDPIEHQWERAEPLLLPQKRKKAIPKIASPIEEFKKLQKKKPKTE